MRTRGAWIERSWTGGVGVGLVLVVMLGGFGVAARGDIPGTPGPEEGRELFFREWVAGDSRSHGGDGLGPVYNDTSCVACHNAGGPGGGGPKSKNVDIISAFPTQVLCARRLRRPRALRIFSPSAATAPTGIDLRPPPRSRVLLRKPDTRELIKAHAGFRTARSVVLHRFLGPTPSTKPGIPGDDRPGTVQSTSCGPRPRQRTQQGARAEIDQTKMFLINASNDIGNQQRIGEFALRRSQRNPSALFGAGLIDTILDAVLEAAASRKGLYPPEIAWRVSRQKGRADRPDSAGRRETPRLDDFVRTACGVELGLDVPGHHQGGPPQKPEAKPTGLPDLSDQECGSLLAYVASLAEAGRWRSHLSSLAERQTVAAGRAHFDRIGCASCHTPKLGSVEGNLRRPAPARHGSRNR